LLLVAMLRAALAMRPALRIGLIAALTLALTAHAVSADIVAVVSAKSSITTLSKIQIVDIFLGKQTRFPDGSAAVPIDQSEGTAARDQFYSRFAGMSPAQLKAFWSRIIFTGRGQPPAAVATGAEAKKLLLANSNAIGYLDQSMVDDSLRVVQSP
jgi:ABC-type phosphate transport system substrate-binding protein